MSRLPPMATLLDENGALLSTSDLIGQSPAAEASSTPKANAVDHEFFDEPKPAADEAWDPSESSEGVLESASVADLESGWKPESIAEHFARDAEDLPENPGDLPAALDFEGELSDVVSEEPPVELEAPLLAGVTAQPSRPKVPLAEDQRYYEERHPMPRKRLNLKSLVRVTGPMLVAVPVIILIAWHAGFFGETVNEPMADRDLADREVEFERGSSSPDAEAKSRRTEIDSRFTADLPSMTPGTSGSLADPIAPGAMPTESDASESAPSPANVIDALFASSNPKETSDEPPADDLPLPGLDAAGELNLQASMEQTSKLKRSEADSVRSDVAIGPESGDRLPSRPDGFAYGSADAIL
ncbi:MAG: hypothetical protein AAGJ83_04670, partial [Planctomycetota bacterium]